MEERGAAEQETQLVSQEHQEQALQKIRQLTVERDELKARSQAQTQEMAA